MLESKEDFYRKERFSYTWARCGPLCLHDALVCYHGCCAPVIFFFSNFRLSVKDEARMRKFFNRSSGVDGGIGKALKACPSDEKKGGMMNKERDWGFEKNIVKMNLNFF